MTVNNYFPLIACKIFFLISSGKMNCGYFLVDTHDLISLFFGFKVLLLVLLTCSAARAPMPACPDTGCVMVRETVPMGVMSSPLQAVVWTLAEVVCQGNQLLNTGGLFFSYHNALSFTFPILGPQGSRWDVIIVIYQSFYIQSVLEMVSVSINLKTISQAENLLFKLQNSTISLCTDGW